MKTDSECKELTGELKFDINIDSETGYIKESSPEDHFHTKKEMAIDHAEYVY